MKGEALLLAELKLPKILLTCLAREPTNNPTDFPAQFPLNTLYLHFSFLMYELYISFFCNQLHFHNQ